MQRLKIAEKFGYGLGDTASNIVFQVVINFMLYFYTDVFGITAAAAGTLMLAVRMFDAITDPIMGGIADRTRTRWGSYRPYLLWISIPYGLLAVLTFTTPDLSDGGKLLYAYVTYALLMTAYTAINIPYSALGGVITSDPQERASVQSWRFMLAMVGGALVAATTLPMVEFFGGENEQKGFQMAMAVLSVIAVGCFIACFVLTRERENPTARAARQSMGADFISLMRNDQWMIIAIVTFILLISVAMKGASMPYYVSYYLDSKSSITLFMTSNMLAGVAGAMFANWMTRYFCKVTVMRWASLALALVYTAMAFVQPDQYMLALVLTICSNFVHMIIIPYLFSAVADTVDYGLQRWGKGAMAMSYSGHLLALKIGIALGGALSGWILAYVGYQPNVQQTETALSGIVFLYTWASAIAGILLLVCFSFYRLNRKWAKQNDLLAKEAA